METTKKKTKGNAKIKNAISEMTKSCDTCISSLKRTNFLCDKKSTETIKMNHREKKQ